MSGQVRISKLFGTVALSDPLKNHGFQFLNEQDLRILRLVSKDFFNSVEDYKYHKAWTIYPGHREKKKMAVPGEDPEMDSIIKQTKYGVLTCVHTLRQEIDFNSMLVGLPNGDVVVGVHRSPIVGMVGRFDLYNNPNERGCLRILHNNTSPVMSLVALLNGNIAIGSYYGEVKIWDPNTGECLQILHNNTHSVDSLAALLNGNIAIGSFDNEVKIRDPNTGECLRTLRHTDRVFAIAAMPNGNLATYSLDHKLKIWDPNTGECIHTFAVSYNLCALAVLPDGKLVTGSGPTRISERNIISIWDLNKSKKKSVEQSFELGEETPINASSIAVLPGGKIVVGSLDCQVVVIDVTECPRLLARKIECIARSVVVTPAGLLVTSSFSGTVSIWDLFSPQDCITRFITSKNEIDKKLFETLPNFVKDEIYTNLFKIAQEHNSYTDPGLEPKVQGKVFFDDPSYDSFLKLEAIEIYQKKLGVKLKKYRQYPH